MTPWGVVSVEEVSITQRSLEPGSGDSLGGHKRPNHGELGQKTEIQEAIHSSCRGKEQGHCPRARKPDSAGR